MPDSILLCRFMKAEWALKSLQEARLRVSRIKELNDPFEWRVGSKADNPNDQAFMREILERSCDRLHDRFGILCFSGWNSDPVIWSHYADSHQGIALEFDHFIAPGLHEVQYENKRPVFDFDHQRRTGGDPAYTRGLLEQFLSRKAPSWAYEREYRVAFELGSECTMDGANYFKPIPENFLTRVILGVRCTATEAAVERSLKQGGLDPVPIVRARMSDTSYDIFCD
jgi:hypothetical protein